MTAFDRATLPAIDHRGRVDALQSMLRTSGPGHDAILYIDLVDVRWLTGFTGSNGWVVVTADDLVLGTDGRYGDRAVAETSGTGATVIAETSRVRLHERLVASLGARESVGLDPATTTQSAWTGARRRADVEPDGFAREDAPRGQGRGGDRPHVGGGRRGRRRARSRWSRCCSRPSTSR